MNQKRLWPNLGQGRTESGVQSYVLQVYYSVTAGIASMQSESLREIYLFMLS